MAFSSQSFTAPSIPKLNRRTISSPLSSSASKISGVAPKLKTSGMRFFRPSLKKTNVTAEEITQKSSIENTLVETNTILVEIQKQLSLDFAMRIAEEKERNKVLKEDKSRRRLALKEGAVESTRRIGNIVKSATGKILAPVKGVFDKIMEFLSIIGTGIAANATFEWLKDDENKQKLQGWFNFIVEHWKWGLVALGAVAALNLVGPISALVKVLKIATGLLVGGIKPLLALLGSKAFLAAAGITLGIGGTLFGMKAAVDFFKRRSAGGEDFYNAFEALKGQLAEQEITVIGSGKDEKFYVGKYRGQGGGAQNKTLEESGSEDQKKLVKEYIKKRDALIQLRTKRDGTIESRLNAYEPVPYTKPTGSRARFSRDPNIAAREQIRSDTTREFGDKIQGILEQRAMGGPVTAGNPYIVGEKGPEFFIPNINGSVVNNYKTEKIYEMISSKNAGKINFITMDLPPQVIKKEKSIPTPPAPPVPNISSTNAADLWRVKTPDIYGIYV
jgi:hypothetical protein